MSIGCQPSRFLPLKSGSGLVHALGALRFNSGARTPVNAKLVSPRFWTPVSLSPAASSSQVVAGRPGAAEFITMLRCEPFTLKSLTW